MEKFDEVLKNGILTPSQQENAKNALSDLRKAREAINLLKDGVSEKHENYAEAQKLIDEAIIIVIASSANSDFSESHISDTVEYYLR